MLSGVTAGSRLQPLDTLDTRFVTARRPSPSRFNSHGDGLSGERCGAPHDGHKALSPRSCWMRQLTRQLPCRLANSLPGQRLELACRTLSPALLLMPTLRIHERSSFSL